MLEATVPSFEKGEWTINQMNMKKAQSRRIFMAFNPEG
jgi:hypothetical protein